MSMSSPVRQPTIITGVRGPEHRAKSGQFGSPLEVKVPEGHRVFRARARNYRLNMGKLPDRYDNARGVHVPGFEFSAAFKDWLITLPGYFRAHSIPEEMEAEWVKRLEESSAYRVDIFDMAEIAQQGREANVKSIRDQLRADPDLRDRLRADLEAGEGFIVEPAESAAEVPDELASEPAAKPAFACSECPKSFDSPKALRMHGLAHQRRKSRPKKTA